MAKKKEVEEIKEVRTVLHADEYWQWRNSCAELWNANSKVKIAELEAKVLEKDAEIMSWRLKLHHASKLRAVKEEALNCSTEYSKLKEVLEQKLGISLNNKAIDEVTFEVKELPEGAESKENK